MSYEIHLQQFDGPLDFLLHLIRREQIDIRDIFVSEITNQYLACMEGVSELDMETASDFLDIAATLIYIKSRSLLPRQNTVIEKEEETPEQQLIRRLREYEQIKSVSSEMGTLYETASRAYTKLPEDILPTYSEIELENGESDALYEAFLSVLKKAEDKRGVPSERIRKVAADKYTVRDSIKSIRDNLRASKASSIRFEQLFSQDAEKMEIVVTFMALLEMLAHGEITVRQSAPFHTITVSAKRLLDDEADTDIYMDEETK